MRYTGQKCVVCDNVFDENDDIVVCPDCGAPQHRECYKKENLCGWCGKSDAKISWNPEISETEKNETAEKECPVCRHMNPSDAESCGYCGCHLISGSKKEDEESDEEFSELKSFFGFDPDEDMGGATLGEMSQFVKSNTVYYIPIFKRMKKMGSKLSLNLLCFIFPPFFFANRRMWGWAVLSSFIMVFLALPLMMSYLVGDGMESGAMLFSNEIINMIYNNRKILLYLVQLFNAIDFAFRTGICLFGNYIYFRFALKSLVKLKKRHGYSGSIPDTGNVGGVKPFNMVIVTVMIMVISFAALFAATFGLELLFVFGTLA